MKFADVVNPTADELRQWASNPDAVYPDEIPQDWDLIVADWSRVVLIVELASDEACPNRDFFLAVLYLMAGDCVRTPGGEANIPDLRALLTRLEKTSSKPLALFRDRAAALFADPSKFEYDLWCNGGWLHVRSDPAGER